MVLPGLLLCSAWFAPEPISVDNDAALEVIQVTASRRSSRTTDVIAPVSVVESGQLQRLTPLVTADALRGQPGVFVQQTTPGQGIPIVRGLKGSEVLHLVDGMRFNNALFRNAPNQYLALLDTALLERVEVVRGPVSTLYGADAMGGVVQFITRRPQFAKEPSSGFRATLGSADNSSNLAVFHEQGSPTDAVRVALGYQDVGDRETALGTVAPSGYRARSAAVSWRHQLSDSAEIQLDLQHLRQPSTPRIDELVAGFGEDEAASAEFFFAPNQRDFAHLRWQRQSAEDWLDSMAVHLAVQRVTDDRRTRARDSQQRRLENNVSTLWGLTTQFDKTSAAATQWTWGAELYHDTIDSARVQENIVNGALTPTASRFPDGSTLQSAALFVQATHELGQRLQAEAGLRYSRFNIDLAATESGPAAELDPDRVTGSLGLRWELAPNWRLVANLGQGFRAPNIFDLGALGERPGNRFNIANAQLQPERLLGLDIGVKWSGKRSVGELIGFVSSYEDKIVSQPTGERTAAGRIVVRSENQNEVRLNGLELGLRHLLSPSTTIVLNVTHVHGTETATPQLRQPADRVPPLSGQLGIQWQPAPNWRIDSQLLFAGRQDRLSDRDRTDPRINPDGTPGWSSFNVRIGWQFAQRWELGLRAHNLLDRAYREHGSGIDAPGRGLIVSLQRGF